jgi:DNA/RNA-binding domain of Phe-tRNA-synthetase-like protein
MQKIQISRLLAERVPTLNLSCIACDVAVEAKNPALWHIIEQKVAELSKQLKVEDISKLPAIAASRKAYKACGKDPARYRLSAEALLRRVVKRSEIYQVNNVVDALNLVSINSGFSIGGYDADKINGDVVFGIGNKDEPYTGIGRGELNIESMPVFRDAEDAFGTPTSDSVRTSVTPNTRRFLMIIIDFGAKEGQKEATDFALNLLREYANATNFELETITGK